MDSSVRDSKVNPIENSEGESNSDGREGNEQESLLMSIDGDDEVGKKEKQVEAKKKRRVHWIDDNHDGNQLAQIMEFPPSELSDDDGAQSGSCPCTIM